MSRLFLLMAWVVLAATSASASCPAWIFNPFTRKLDCMGGAGGGAGDITAVGDCSTGACFQSATQNGVFAGPVSGGDGQASVRLLDPADIPDLSSIYLTVEVAQAGSAVRCVSASVSDTYTCTMTPTLTALSDGMLVELEATATSNTGAATLNIDGLGAVAIKKANGSTDPDNNDITAGRQITLKYDGTVFRLPIFPNITLTTTVGDPGSDDAAPTEQAVREALDALEVGGNITLQQEGSPAGVENTVDFLAGDGVLPTLANPSGKVTVQLDVDDTVFLRISNDQSGIPRYAADAGGDDTYTPTLTPPLTAYTKGMSLVFIATTGSTGASTINIDTLGAVALKEEDGTTDATISANRPYLIVYDGTLFRKVGGGSGGGSSTDRTMFSWSSTSGTNFTASQTSYVSISGGSANGSEVNRRTIFPAAGTLSNLWFKTSGTQHATGDLVCNIFLNGTTDTSISVTFTAGSSTTTWSDTVNSQAVSAGDFVSLKCVNGAAGGSSLTLLNSGILFTF
jgi:hypothetical protein